MSISYRRDVKRNLECESALKSRNHLTKSLKISYDTSGGVNCGTAGRPNGATERRVGRPPIDDEPIRTYWKEMIFLVHSDWP
jgi:hypothetical protein